MRRMLRSARVPPRCCAVLRATRTLAHPDAFSPFADWPMAAQPPRCLIEAWPDADPPDGRAYLITARGVGAKPSSAVWLQTQLAVRGGRVVAQRWRRVAALHR
jgi:hypothetical protein